MLVVTTNEVAGERISRTLGQAFGVVVRSRGLGGNIVAGLRSLVGGEIHEYTQMLEEARRHAIDRLVSNASLMGADAVIMMRFDSSELGETMTEVVAYGTAVKLEPASTVHYRDGAEPAVDRVLDPTARSAASASAHSTASSAVPPTFGRRHDAP